MSQEFGSSLAGGSGSGSVMRWGSRYQPGLHSSEGLTRAGGADFKMACSTWLLAGGFSFLLTVGGKLHFLTTWVSP